MRLLGALAYIAFGMWLVFRFVEEPSPLLVGATFFGLVYTSTFLFNKYRVARLKRQSRSEYVEELQGKGRLVSESYESRRAICFEDLNTGCMAYFLDVAEKGVLCLYGQYLYDYEPTTEEGEPRQARQFPCTRFRLLRDRRDRDFLELVLEGDVFEAERIKQPDHAKLRGLGIQLEDGCLHTNVEFGQLRAGIM